MEELREKHFNPKAHILTLLGDELIKSPVMAIYELVKNSYDADADKVNVYFRNIDNIDDAAIIIEDFGTGMTSDVIENVWLEPGSDYRKPVDSDGVRQIKKSPIYKRVPMGEKGVGRFAVHKLGSKILLITRPLLIETDRNNNVIGTQLADYEIQLYINWKDFSQSKHLSDVPIKWKINRDEQKFRFKETSGTYIHLSGLKETWTRAMARKLKGQTLSMLSPKVNEISFKINLNFDNQWLVDFPTADKIIDEAPYKITAFIGEDYDLDFEYEFSLKNNPEIESNIIKNDPAYNKNIKSFIRYDLEKQLENNEYDPTTLNELLKDFDDKPLPFGNLIFEFYSYDLDSASMRDYTESADTLKKILKEHSGIKVFKGDLRIYDYGEPGNDWLGLDLERIQNKSWFSNNQNIGYIYLDPETSGKLVEKTNREGFINDDVFVLFKIVLKYILTEFKATRSSDRAKWLRRNNKASDKSFESKVSNFKLLIDGFDFPEEDKQKLLGEAEKLEEQYEENKNTLLIPAGVGMTASVALHEIEKLVPRMEETVYTVPLNANQIKDQVEELREYTDGIISVLRKGGDTTISIRECVNIAFSNYRLKMKVRKINHILELDDHQDIVKCDKRYFITVLMNIIDNSIYWLDTTNLLSKGIYVKSFRENDAQCLIFVDNGPGFKDEITDLVRPFFSRKTDGIGIGLYLIDTIMMKYGKVDIVTDNMKYSELNIPAEYRGAGVILKFNKQQ
jgi:anti-sigma regulatory factor (Ser/Thr protein kinase)